ncbi:MAG: host-nuclease inhibitor Gam family protein [Candidatus Kapabacteria bacterium]|nr:host-nuclease inhibitor Gam family protein [Candidatus Kapabacteria bacterium]
MAKAKKFTDNFIRFDNRNDLEDAMKTLAVLTAKVDKEEAAYNEAEQKRRAALTENTAADRAQIERIKTSIQRWCEDNRHEFGKSKTLELQHGECSFRTTPPSVKALKGFTLASALELIKRSDLYRSLFVRTKDELDKESILRSFAAWESTAEGQDLPTHNVSAEQLAEFGLQVVQDETFAVTPKFAV